MTSIVKADKDDFRLLSEIATLTFIESHGHCAPPADINSYIAEKYTEDSLQKELLNPQNNYYVLYYNNNAAGYSNIILNVPCVNSEAGHLAKLDRIYLLEKFQHQRLGQQLFQFNVTFAKQNNQAGIWLYTWKENEKAIEFYKRNGFEIIGSHDFKVSATHSNPNHQMLFRF